MKKFDKKEFIFWINNLEKLKGFFKDADFISETQDIEGGVARAIPWIRTDMQKYMEEYPEEVQEEFAQKIHNFDMFVYRHIEEAYTIFSEFYWKRSEYKPPQSHWWWWLDDYFRGKREINPDDVWIKWEKIKAQKHM